MRCVILNRIILIFVLLSVVKSMVDYIFMCCIVLRIFRKVGMVIQIPVLKFQIDVVCRE